MFRKVRCSHLVLCFICLLPTTSSARAQGTAASPSPPVTAAATAERVRFTAPSTVQQIRLEVYNAVGVKLFDNEVRGGNVLDWRLQDGQAEPLADGAYLCLVTVKYLSGRLSQKLGAVIIEQGQATLQPAEAGQMSAQQAQTIGPVEAQAALTVLGEAERPTATVIAHTGSEGQLVRGSGALSFRLGDFYRGQDQEQMRLTAEGKLGLGVADPQAKLDVAGLIRTSEGIVFPDGTVQTTAYVASGRTLSERTGLQRDAQGRNLAAGGAQDKPAGAEKKLLLAPTGSADRIPKFAADGTSLIDSLIKELGGQVSINSPLMVGTNGGAFGRLHVVEPASTIVETLFFENNSTANVTTKGTGIGFYGRDTVNSLKNTGRLAVLPADSNWIDSYMAFYTRSSDAPGERVRITSSGNVGIGTPIPAHALQVNGTTSLGAPGGVYGYLINGASPGPYPSLGFNAYGNFPYLAGVAGYGGIFQFQDGDGTFGFYSTNTSVAAGAQHTFIPRLIILNNGKVGIGTTQPTLGKLHVEGGNGNTSINAVYGSTENGRGVSGTSYTNVGVYGFSQFSSGVQGESAVSSLTAAGVYGKGSGSGSIGVIGEANLDNAVGVFGVSTSPAGVGVYARNLSGGRAMIAEGDVLQASNKGGWVKAMAYIRGDGTIIRCFNSQIAGSAASTVPCGFTVNRVQSGFYEVNFGFPVSDRFVSITPRFRSLSGTTAGNAGANFGSTTSSTIINVLTFVTNDVDNSNDADFMIIVY